MKTLILLVGVVLMMGSAAADLRPAISTQQMIKRDSTPTDQALTAMENANALLALEMRPF